MGESSYQIVATASPRVGSEAEQSSSSGSSWAIGLSALFILSLFLLSLGIASPAAILYTLGTFVLFMLPGLVVMPVFFEDDPGIRMERTVIGGVFGLAISSYTAIVVGFVHGWSPRAIVLALVGLTCACAALGRVFRGRLRLPVRKWTGVDYSIFAGMATLLVLFTAVPSLHVGKLTSHGYAYTWLYGLDFLYRSDVIAAMTTKLPPDLFWMSGVPLRMYLVGYAMPAFAYAASGKTIALHSVLLLMTLGLSFLTLGTIYIFLRTLFSEAKVLLSALFIAVCAYSYYWVYDLVKSILMKPNQRFQFHDGVSHLLQRTFLVEPQAALATSLLLIVLSILALARYRLNDWALAVFLGICLGVCFGTEALQSVAVIPWFGLFYLGRLVLAKRSLRDEYGPFLAAVFSCGIICGSYFLLGMYQHSTSHLVTFGLNKWVLQFGLAYFPLEFGPLLLLGVWGLARWWRGSREDFGWPLVFFGAVTMTEVLFLVPLPPPRMADRLLPVVLLPFAAYLIRDLWLAQSKRSTRLLVTAVILAAIPTFFTDIYCTSNIHDIYYTRYVRVEDKQACDWIRQNLPETAVIQGDYNYFAGGPDRGLYVSLISSFGQRPQVLGWFSGAAILVDDGWRIARERRADIEETLGSDDLSSLTHFIQKYSVDYLYVGPFEQGKYQHLLPLVRSAPEEFREVYSQNGVSIFRCLSRRQPTAAQDGDAANDPGERRL